MICSWTTMRNAGTPFCEYINLCLHAIDSFNSCSCSAARQLKSSLIGSNKQKNLVIRHGVVPRLLLLMQDSTPSPLKVHLAHALGSLAKGSDHHRKELIDHGVFPVLISVLARPETCASPKLVEACLGCIRSVASHPEAPIDMIYSDDAFVPHLISLMAGPSPVNQIAVATIFACACKVRCT